MCFQQSAIIYYWVEYQSSTRSWYSMAYSWLCGKIIRWFDPIWILKWSRLPFSGDLSSVGASSGSILGQDHFFKDLDNRSRSIKWSLSLPLKDRNLNNDQIIIKIIDQDHLHYVLWTALWISCKLSWFSALSFPKRRIIMCNPSPLIPTFGKYLG